MEICSSVFFSENREIENSTVFQDIISLVFVLLGNNQKRSFIVSLGRTVLNWRNQSGLVFQKHEFGRWGVSKFEFRPIVSFWYT
jgi:hypothetical protein